MASEPVYVPDFRLEIGGQPIPNALRGAVTSISYADGHQAAVVGCRHGERQAAAVDLDEDCFGHHLGADGGRLQVVEPHIDAHGRRPSRELTGDGPTARLLAQGDQPRRAEDGDRPGTEGDRRVRLRDDKLRLASQSRRHTHDCSGYGDPLAMRRTWTTNGL